MAGKLLQEEPLDDVVHDVAGDGEETVGEEREAELLPAGEWSGVPVIGDIEVGEDCRRL